MTLKKPATVESDDFKSRKWDEITADRSFRESDVPTIELLCHWYLVAHQCIEELDEYGQTIHVDEQGRPHAMPQLAVMKQASGEIRQLNKQLGIVDTAEGEPEANVEATIIKFAEKRQERRARAAN